MIIFNGQAIVITLLAALLTLPFYGMFHYGWIEESMLFIFASWMVFLASLFGKFAGVIGRLFFIPMWLLSIPLPFIVTYMSYQWTGIGVTFGVFVGIIVLIILWMYIAEHKRLRNLQTEKIEFPNMEEDPLAFWEAAKDKFFLPSFVKMTPDIAKFNIRVCEALERTEVSLESLEAFKSEMRKVQSSGHKLNSDIEKALMTELEHHIALNEKEDEDERMEQAS